MGGVEKDPSAVLYALALVDFEKYVTLPGVGRDRGVPQVCCMHNSQLWLHPIPAAGGECKIRYFPPEMLA